MMIGVYLSLWSQGGDLPSYDWLASGPDSGFVYLVLGCLRGYE
jgi:hypothetical protein